MSLANIGLLSFLSLPWMLKVVWSPFIDRYGKTRTRHYKNWIVVMQGLSVLSIFLCSLLDLNTHLQLSIVGMALSITCAATQDIATDALAVNILSPGERGLGNGVQNAGGYMGGILGGGLLLMLLDEWGWQNSLMVLGTGLLLLLLPIAFYKEQIRVTPHQPSFDGRGLLNFFRQPGMGQWVILLLIYTMGVTISNTMFRPFLVDLGLSLAEIGILYGIVGYSAGIVGSLIGGVAVKALGRQRSLLLFSTAIVVATALFILPTLGMTGQLMLYTAAIGLQLSYSMAYTVLSTIMMDKSRPAMAGFDYTLQVTLVFIGSLLAGGLSGYMVEAIGYRNTFIVSTVISLVTVAFVHWAKRQILLGNSKK